MSIVLKLKIPDVTRILSGSKATLNAVVEGDVDPLLGAAEVLANIMREEIRAPGKGRIYKRRGGVSHQASKPGDPPASDTGNLLNAIATAITRVSKAVKSAGVGIRGVAPYWRDLEFGTVRVAPRPFVRPAVVIGIQGMADTFIKRQRRRVKRLLAARRKRRGG